MAAKGEASALQPLAEAELGLTGFQREAASRLLVLPSNLSQTIVPAALGVPSAPGSASKDDGDDASVAIVAMDTSGFGPATGSDPATGSGSGSGSTTTTVRRALQFDDEYEYQLFTRSVDAVVRQAAAQLGHRSLDANLRKTYHTLLAGAQGVQQGTGPTPAAPAAAPATTTAPIGNHVQGPPSSSAATSLSAATAVPSSPSATFPAASAVAGPSHAGSVPIASSRAGSRIVGAFDRVLDKVIWRSGDRATW